MHSGGCGSKISVKVLLVGCGLFILVPLGHATTVYRSYDGTGNNATHAAWGSAGSQLIRLGAASYADQISAPRGGSGLPSTRDVSNAVVKQTQSIPNANGVSAMLMQWGQFLDHDLDLTRAGTSEPLPIAIRSDDPVFGGNYSGSGMPFQRSVFDTSTGTADDNPRQQVNAVTAFLDASQIYGSSQTEADNLRYLSGGKLKMSGDMLHMLDSTDDGKDNPTFVSGDERAREQVGLTSMHTLFNREHNRLAAGFE